MNAPPLRRRRPWARCGFMVDFYAADMHFGHHKIREYTGRPYHSTAEMDADMSARWNAVVEPHHRVLIVGDGWLGQLEQTLTSIALLNGYLILVPGNHDRVWLGDKRRDQWLARYLDAGVNEIVDGPISHTVGGHIVTVDHFPYRGDSTHVERHREWRPCDNGGWLIHGHVHDKWRQRGRQINVGSDAWGGFPVAASTVAAMIDGGEHHLEPLEWVRDWEAQVA